MLFKKQEIMIAKLVTSQINEIKCFDTTLVVITGD